MFNTTHTLAGLALARLGLDRHAPYALWTAAIAANLPDIDIVYAFDSTAAYLQHHRGITHAIVGVIGLAFLVPLIFYAVDHFGSRFRNQAPTTKLKGLLIASFIASATHPFLDWTNNYGIRFFLPWSQKWSYGDFVFIVDPYLWLILGGAAFLLTAKTRFYKTIWALIAAGLSFLIIVSPRGNALPNPRLIALLWIVTLIALIVLFVRDAGERWGSRIAFVAIALSLCYWTFLAFAHSKAVARGSEEAAKIATANGETVARLAAMPRPANAFRWDCVFETDRAMYRFELGLMDENPAGPPVRYAKPRPELVNTVSGQRPGRVFLGFARFPVMQLSDPGCTTRTLVQLADLRYTEPGGSRGNFAFELPIDCPRER